MSNRRTLIRLALSILPLLSGCAIGCGPDTADKVPDDAAERFAKAMCSAYDRCGCTGEGFDGVESCRSESAAIFRSVEDWPGVKFDGDCFEDFLDFVEANDCSGPGSGGEPIPCEVFRGTVRRGEACVADAELEGPYGGLSGGPCGDNGTCTAGKCISPPAPQVELGAPCELELGVRCGQGNYCASDGLCRPQVGAGAACDTPRACEDSGEYCAGLVWSRSESGVCTDRVAQGESCNPDEVESCEPGYIAYCTTAGACAAAWPTVCAAVTPPRDGYDAREWVPLR